MSTVPAPLLITVSVIMDNLKGQSLGTWAAAVYYAHGSYDLSADDVALLARNGLIQDGRMHPATKEAIRELFPHDTAPPGRETA